MPGNEPVEPTKVQRWLDIIAYLAGRRLPVSADELMRNVPAYAAKWASDDPRAHEAARRGFERDKDELRRFGIPIRTIRYNIDQADAQEGYSITKRDFYLPFLRLIRGSTLPPRGYPEPARPADFHVSEQDAPLALDALRRVVSTPGFPLAREARSAFRKLAFDLDPQHFGSRGEVLFIEPPGTAELSDRLRVLSDALLARKCVTFRYHGIHRGEETEREVDAYGLLFQHGHWYLLAHDRMRDGLRIFRVGRMEDVKANRRKPNTPDYEIPESFRLDDYVGREAWELGDAEENPLTARVRFRFPLSLWAERNAYGTFESQDSEGSTVRRFTVHQVNPFLRWLLSLEGEAEILDPPVLNDELRALAATIAKAHRADVANDVT